MTYAVGPVGPTTDGELHVIHFKNTNLRIVSVETQAAFKQLFYPGIVFLPFETECAGNLKASPRYFYVPIIVWRRALVLLS